MRGGIDGLERTLSRRSRFRPALVNAAAPVPNPYEASNVALTFFALGARCAALQQREGAELSVTLAAFQQSPLDHELGDAKLAVGGRHVLIEFKRDERDLRSEIRGKSKRADLLRALKRRTPEMTTMRRRSLRGHLIAFRNTGSASVLDFGPYFTVLSPLLKDEGHADFSVLVPLSQFVDTLLLATDKDHILQDTISSLAAGGAPLRSLGMSLEDFAEYVSVVLNPPADGTSDGGAAGAVGHPSDASGNASAPGGHGGVLVSVSATGELSCAFYDSDADLARLQGAAATLLARCGPQAGAGAATAPIAPGSALNRQAPTVDRNAHNARKRESPPDAGTTRGRH